MKKTVAFILAVLTLVLMAACTNDTANTTDAPSESAPAVSSPVASESEDTATPTPSPVVPTPTPTPTPSESSDEIVATLTAKTYEVVESGKDSVVIEGKAKAVAGDKLVVKAPTNYLKIEAKGVAGSAIVYMPDKTFTYVHAANAATFLPAPFANGKMKFTLSTPTAEELAEVRNIAANPFDSEKDTTAFPHATTNNEHDQSGQFIARNAIDGYTSNKGHGSYPNQSWGPKSTVLATDYYTIDFGREVTVSSIALYLRADGFSTAHSHDAYFSEITLEFSDGSSVKINPTKTADKQTFEFDEKTTTSIKLTGFVTDKSNSDGWAAVTEIQVMGKEA